MVLAETSPVTGTAPWTDLKVKFSVPSSDCKAQWLKLIIPARTASETEIEGEVWFQGFRVTPRRRQLINAVEPWRTGRNTRYAHTVWTIGMTKLGSTSSNAAWARWRRAKVLVSQVQKTSPIEISTIIPGHSELNRMVLLKLGVPEAAIGMFGEANRNTNDEAVALRDWANRHGASRIVIPTEIFAARRVQWIFNREFAGSSVRLEIASFEPRHYTRAEWWKTEAGMIAFQNEVMKYIYYRLKY